MNKLNLKDYKNDETVIYVIDMNNGFAKKGNLYSPNVKGLIPNMVDFLYQARKTGIEIVSINDRHKENDIEFKIFPPHCIVGTKECETVREIRPLVDKEYYKKTTNALLAINPKIMFKGKKTVIIVGCVTDICIKIFAIALKKYFEENNLDIKVIVIEDLVTTFDMEGHEAEQFHNNAIQEMIACGIEVVTFKEKQQFGKEHVKK